MQREPVKNNRETASRNACEGKADAKEFEIQTLSLILNLLTLQNPFQIFKKDILI